MNTEFLNCCIVHVTSFDFVCPCIVNSAIVLAEWVQVPLQSTPFWKKTQLCVCVAVGIQFFFFFLWCVTGVDLGALSGAVLLLLRAFPAVA